MSYFAPMSSVWYTLPDGVTTILVNDITSFATIIKTWKTDATIQLAYKIQDGELPHMISVKLYDKVDFWWTILQVNDIYDFDNQWPRSYDQLNDYIDAKYPGQPRNTVHHYLDTNGLIADLLSLRIESGSTDNNYVINYYGLTPVSIVDYEVAVNEAKRDIILIDPDFIDAVQTAYNNAMET